MTYWNYHMKRRLTRDKPSNLSEEIRNLFPQIIPEAEVCQSFIYHVYSLFSHPLFLLAMLNFVQDDDFEDG